MPDILITVVSGETTNLALAVPGTQGPIGLGFPSGGTTNQVLFKQSNTNYDATWGNVTSAMISDLSIVDADISASAAIVDTKLATIATAGKVSNSATTATDANTASAIVARDASGNFTAGTITAALTGAASANVLKAGDTMTGVLAVTAGTAALPAITPSGDPNTGIYSPGADQVAISTNGTGRLFIGSTGNVGIGTSSPNRPLEVFGSTSSFVRLTHTGLAATGLDIGYSSAGYAIVNNTENTALAFQTNNAERMRLTSTGLLGLGTSSPGGRLHAVGTLSGFPVTSGTTQTFGVLRLGGSDTNGILDFGVNGSTQWIQSTDQTNLSQKYSLLLNPNGGNVGIGITSPGDLLHVMESSASAFAASAGSVAQFERNSSVGITLSCPDASTGSIFFGDTASSTIGRISFDHSDDSLQFWSSTERARIDSSGRLLVGTSTAVSVNGITGGLELHAVATTNGAAASIARFDNSAPGPQLNFGKSRSGTLSPGTIVQNNDPLGDINFCGDDGTDINSRAARISCEVDGTPGADDMPGRLVFSVTADGSTSPTEALRISSNRAITVSDGGNVVLGTTTGTKIGTATTQKLGFYDATPVVQPTAVADATTAVDVITQLNDLLAKLRTLGIIAT